MKPNVIAQIEEGMRGGKTGFVLEFNTNDRLLYPELNIAPSSLHLALASYFGRHGYHCGIYSCGLRGVQELVPPGSTAQGTNPFHQRTTVSGLNLCTPILRRNDIKVALFIQYADLLAPTSDGNIFLQPEQQTVLETLHRWGADDSIRQPGNIVVLISYEGGVNNLLTRSGVYRMIQVPLPDESTRREFVNCLLGIGHRNKRFGSLEEGFSSEELVRTSNGLRLTDLETLFRAKTDALISRADIQTIKSNAIREMAGGLVEVIEPEEGFESIAGLESAKEYFQFLKWMFQNGSPAVPYAMILAGVPGAGKSKLCGTLAKELNLPLLIIRNLHGPFVGQSEANLERVLHIVDSLSPCIVLIEEIDQWIGQRGTGASGDSGTTNRMSQRFWEALGSSQKNRGKNLWIGTSNRPDLLDSAMLDRFQVIIPFLHPTPNEVAQLLPFLAGQIKRRLSEDVILQDIAGLPNLYLPTVRGLVEIMTSAAQRADYEKGKTDSIITHDHLLAAAMDYKITYDIIQHEYIALKAVEMVSFASLFPWMTLKGKRPVSEIPAYLQNIVDKVTGYVDSTRLAERIRELENAMYSQKMMR